MMFETTRFEQREVTQVGNKNEKEKKNPLEAD